MLPLIIEHVKTTRELFSVKNYLRMLSDLFYQEDKKYFKDAIENQVPDWLSEIMMDLIKKKGIDTVFNKINECIKEMDKLMVIKVVLAYEPSDLSTGRIVSWFRDNIDKTTVLDIDYNPEIIAGIIFEYGGIHHDLSLKKNIDLRIDSDKEKLLEILAK